MQLVYVSFFFFFFQAEDGIRDVAVTGVQTCALPISARPCLQSLLFEASLPSERMSTEPKKAGDDSPSGVYSRLSATKIISGESSRTGVRSKSPYSAVTLNPQRTSKCSTS